MWLAKAIGQAALAEANTQSTPLRTSEAQVQAGDVFVQKKHQKVSSSDRQKERKCFLDNKITKMCCKQNKKYVHQDIVFEYKGTKT